MNMHASISTWTERHDSTTEPPRDRPRRPKARAKGDGRCRGRGHAGTARKGESGGAAACASGRCFGPFSLQSFLPRRPAAVEICRCSRRGAMPVQGDVQCWAVNACRGLSTTAGRPFLVVPRAWGGGGGGAGVACGHDDGSGRTTPAKRGGDATRSDRPCTSLRPPYATTDNGPGRESDEAECHWQRGLPTMPGFSPPSGETGTSIWWAEKKGGNRQSTATEGVENRGEMLHARYRHGPGLPSDRARQASHAQSAERSQREGNRDRIIDSDFTSSLLRE